MDDEKWDAWDDYDGCIRQIHIEVAICIVTETALRWGTHWKQRLKEHKAVYGEASFNALSLAQ